MAENRKKSLIPGITLRSVSVSILLMLLTAFLIHFIGCTDSWHWKYGDEAIPIPAVTLFFILSLVAGSVYSLTRVRFLTKAEMFCVLFACLTAAPLMAHGIWRQMLSLNSAMRAREFEQYDAFSGKLWAHGENLLEGGQEKDFTGLSLKGNVEWREIDVNKGRTEPCPVLENSEEGISSVRYKLDLREEGKYKVYPETPHFISILARAEKLGATSKFFCRLYCDDNPEFHKEIISAQPKSKITCLQRTGFARLGSYGLKIPRETREHFYIEFGLSGPGRVELADPVLCSVNALESAFIGHKIVSESQYLEIPEEHRVNLIVRPDNLFSLKGLKFLFTGWVPFRDWINPVFGWCSYVVLILAAMFAVMVLMRRQWMQNERYPMPNAQVLIKFLGAEDDEEDSALPPIWKNRFMWIGFAVVLFWCLMRGWRDFNPNVPNLNLDISLKSYLADSSWGKTWNNVNFSVFTLFLSLGLFMELNILLSLVIGFLLFRMQHWFGETQGLSSDTYYPYIQNQQVGSYIAYFVMLLFFTRKYLWDLVKKAVKGENDTGEVVSYRTAFLILAGSLLGVFIWSKWADVPPLGNIVFFLIICSVGFVAAKFRTECGTPAGGFAPAKLILIVPLIGGLAFFEPRGFLFASYISAVVCSTSFLLIPGLQMELLEIGKRVGVRRGHIACTAALGVMGGVVIGGWVYLSSTYAVGADNYPRPGQYMYKKDFSETYQKEMNKFSGELRKSLEEKDSAPSEEREKRGISGEVWGFSFAAAATIVLTLLRQYIAGFWFHPVGFILGSTGMMGLVWGSLLAAWAIRFSVLKLGGAATVREKLIPFACGMFLATITSYFIFTLINAYIFFFHHGSTNFTGPIL